MKLIVLLLSFISILSCREKLYTEDFNRNKLCQYFTIQSHIRNIEGKDYTLAYLKINKLDKDKTSDFIQKHFHRFDYLINKTFFPLTTGKTWDDSIILKEMFCKALLTDSFYYRISLLTSSRKTNNSKQAETYSISEVMKIASRFFYCQSIREKDTVITTFICVGKNGISELQSSRDYTALEAFCFEAIFKNLRKNKKFADNFYQYVHAASQEDKQNFIDFKTHLATVRNKCFTAMEKDKDLKTVLMKYYKQNKNNINFSISSIK